MSPLRFITAMWRSKGSAMKAKNFSTKALIGVAFALLFCTNLQAKNEVNYFDLQKALQSAEFKQHLSGKIEFKFGENSGKNENIIISGLTSNKKAARGGKSEEASCQRALLNALITFEKRAIKEGGTKVVNLTGYYYKKPYDMTDKFQCGVGSLMTGVTLKGDIAK